MSLSFWANVSYCKFIPSPARTTINNPFNMHLMTILALVTFGAVFSLVWGETYQERALIQHNGHRQMHQVDNMTTSADLNNLAVICAQYYAKLGKIDHSCPNKSGAGENLYAQWGGVPSDMDAAQSSCDAWYAEVKGYNYSADWQQAHGHFSQMVWKGSTQLGFGTGRNGTMTVGCALYIPHGNILGQFKDNVFPPK